MSGPAPNDKIPSGLQEVEITLSNVKLILSVDHEGIYG